MPLGVAAAQNRAVVVRFASGDSILSDRWYFEYGCLTALRDNPGLAASRSDTSQALRLRADSNERVLPQRQLNAIRFVWSTSPAGRLMRSRAQVQLVGGEIIQDWQPGTRGCEDVYLVIPPGETRTGWLRIDLWRTVAYAVPAPATGRATEIRFQPVHRPPLR
jgi:hypothetical protein